MIFIPCLLTCAYLTKLNEISNVSIVLKVILPFNGLMQVPEYINLHHVDSCCFGLLQQCRPHSRRASRRSEKRYAQLNSNSGDVDLPAGIMNRATYD